MQVMDEDSLLAMFALSQLGLVCFGPHSTPFPCTNLSAPPSLADRGVFELNISQALSWNALQD